MIFHAILTTTVVLVLLLLLNVVITTIDALPSGSPVCTVGSAAPQSLHLSRSTIITGTLPLASFQVKIGTTTLSDGGSLVNTITAANTNLPLEVTSTNGTQFRGVLVILNSQPNVNLVSNMFISPTSTTLQVQSSCAASNYSGFTHTSNALKSSVQATINLPSNRAVFLDVNVVVANNNAQGSLYFYSRYQLSTVVAAPPVPVGIPVTRPIPAPVMVVSPSAPRNAPIPAPVVTPKSVPVVAPVPISTPIIVPSPVTAPTRTSCGLLGLSIFCINGCGLFRRIFGLC